jgi:hypothetical protein
VNLSRRLNEMAIWSGTALNTNLANKIATIQPVGWSALLDGVGALLRAEADDYFRARYKTAKYDLVIVPA